MLGKDPAIPPGLPGMITVGSPNVMVGGIPVPNMADIAARVVRRLSRRRPRAAAVVANAFMVGPTSGCD